MEWRDHCTHTPERLAAITEYIQALAIEQGKIACMGDDDIAVLEVWYLERMIHTAEAIARILGASVRYTTFEDEAGRTIIVPDSVEVW